MAQDRDGREELFYCAVDGDCEGVRRRLAAGDDPSLADRQGYTPLHVAAQHSHAAVVELLLEAGATVDPQERHGNTPLWKAVFDARGRTETVAALLKAGADPDVVNKVGATPRSLATSMGYPEIAALLADHD